MSAELKPKHEAVMRKAAAAIRARGHEGDARLADSLLGIIASMQQPAATPAQGALTDAETIQLAADIFGFKLHKQDEETKAKWLLFAQRVRGRVSERKLIAWVEQDCDDWHVYGADSDTGQHIDMYQKESHYISVFPLYGNKL